MRIMTDIMPQDNLKNYHKINKKRKQPNNNKIIHTIPSCIGLGPVFTFLGGSFQRTKVFQELYPNSSPPDAKFLCFFEF